MGQKDFNSKVESLLNHTVPVIHVEELQKLDSSSTVVLDTRTPEEFEVSHLKGSRFVDYKNFSNEMIAGIDKEDTVIVYCSVGYRSEKIGEKLQELGFKNVKNLHGGIFDWKNKGNEVYNKTGATDSVHTYNRSWSKWLNKGVKVY